MFQNKDATRGGLRALVRFVAVGSAMLVVGCSTVPDRLRTAAPAPDSRNIAYQTPGRASGVSPPAAKTALLGRKPGFGVDYTQMINAGHAPDIWPRIRAGFGLPSVPDPRLNAELSWYTDHPQYLNAMWRRAEKYLYFIVTEVERRKLPSELALLPVIESGFRPTAVSSSSAAGLWQFVPGTAAIRGLSRDSWVDESVDIVTSTNAALDYLEDLNRMFGGDWLLTLAAYNGGPGYISRMREANRKAGRGTRFRDLPVRNETRSYVWRMLALRQLVLRPASGGIRLPDILNAPYFAAVDVNAPLHLNQLATLQELTREELDALNPGLRQGITPPGRSHQVLVPMELARSVRNELASGRRQPPPMPATRTRPVTLASLNPIGLVEAAPTTGRAPSAASSRCTATYAVRRGDTLTSIARLKGQSPAEIKACNAGLLADRLKVGQRLRVPPPSRAGATTSKVRTVSYRVRAGDTYTRISANYGTDLHTFMNWNRHLAGTDGLRAGEQLQLRLAN